MWDRRRILYSSGALTVTSFLWVLLYLLVLCFRTEYYEMIFRLTNTPNNPLRDMSNRFDFVFLNQIFFLHLCRYTLSISVRLLEKQLYVKAENIPR